MKSKLFLLSTTFAVASFGFATTPEQTPEECVKPWMYFDLGNTIVDTKTNNYNPMFYMEDVAAKEIKDGVEVYKWQDGPLYLTAQNYVTKLQTEGYPLGMLIDVPQSWGENWPTEAHILDKATAKIVRTLDFLNGFSDDPERPTSWDKEKPRFDYTPFGKFVSGQGQHARDVDYVPLGTFMAGTQTVSAVHVKFQGEILLPRTTEERKSEGSLYLFEQAVAHAKEKNCTAIYQGEDTKEMELAERAGMTVFQIGVTSQKYFYLPPSKVDWYLEKIKANKNAWKGLGVHDLP